MRRIKISDCIQSECNIWIISNEWKLSWFENKAFVFVKTIYQNVLDIEKWCNHGHLTNVSYDDDVRELIESWHFQQKDRCYIVATTNTSNKIAENQFFSHFWREAAAPYYLRRRYFLRARATDRPECTSVLLRPSIIQRAHRLWLFFAFVGPLCLWWLLFPI